MESENFDIDEREAMQEKTFRKWINAQLIKGEATPINDLFRDLKDGRKLLTLLEILTGEKLPREKGRMRVHSLNNINRALQFLQDKNVKLVNVNSNDIADGNPKITLGLVWTIIQHHWNVYVEDESLDFRQCTLEQALLRWCRKYTKGYEGVDIRNFTTCWKDGLAFNALIHRFRPELFDFGKVRAASVNDRLAHVFKVAEIHLNVFPLLDPEDVNSDHVDKKSVLTYVMCLFQALPHGDVPLDESPPVSESPAPESSISDRAPSSSPSVKAPKILPDEAASMGMTQKSSGDKLKDYQMCLEEVLTWLLDAEETLQNMGAVEENDVEIVKQQFREHEDFMVNLTRNQGGIGDALHQASGLIDGHELNDDEKLAVRKQMYLLNEKWESIREGAMDRQSKLQDRLMVLQQAQLVNMDKWLTKMEATINKSEPIGTDSDVVKRQIESHLVFQKEIEKQQATVNSLANMVVVVDESTPGEQSYVSLEEKLKEIGKRWHAVCQWAEKRALRLENFDKTLQYLMDETRHFADWLDQREAASATLKSAHHLSSPQDVLQQVQNLQTMQQDLESEHPRFIKFSQISSEAASKLEMDNAVGAANIRRRHEEVSQRWENLVCQMDGHSSALIRSGKVDPKKIKMPKLFSYTKTEYTENPSGAVVKKTITTTVVKKHVVLDDINQAEVTKKMKLQTPAVDVGSFETVLNEFCRWLDKIEATLSLPFDDLELKEQVASYESAEAEVKRHESDLESVHTKGHLTAEQKRLAGESAEDIEARLHDVNTRWRDLCLSLAERKRKIHVATETERFGKDLKQIDEAVDGLSEWVRKFDPGAVADVSKVRSALHDCQDKLEVVKQKEPQVEALHSRLQKLIELSGLDDPAVVSLQKQFDHFTEKWAHVVEKISGALESLTTSINKAPSPNMEAALTSLNDWLDSAEDIIATQDLDTIDHLDVTQTKIDRLKELQNQLFMQQETLNFVCSTAEELVAEKADGFEELSVQLVKLAPRWADIERVLNGQLQRLENGFAKLKDWDRKATEMDQWMDQVTEFVHAEQPAVGNLETLKAQLEQSRGLTTDIDTLRPKMQQIEASVAELTPMCTPQLKDYLTTRMDEIDKRWTDVLRLAKAKYDGLQDVYSRSQRVFDDIQQLTKWLSSVEEELNLVVDPASGKELQTLIKRHKQLKDELQNRSETVEAAVCLGEEIVGSFEGSPEAAQQLQGQLNATRKQWSAICQHVRDKLQSFTEAFEQWKELQELLAAEKICLDQLERKLNEPMTSAADAEEYSEQLDLLERLMEGSGGHARVVEIGNSLISKSILTNAVKTELNKYYSRRENLMEPAKERQKYLETGVHESQEFEQQLLNCQSWVTHVDFILSTRLNSDILASDLPQEYKRALASGQLVPQLQTEFDEHDECIKRLEEQVTIYRQNNKHEAAGRLAEQVDHVKKQIGEIQAKFDKYKRPGNMESMLERMWRISKDIEQGIVLLRLESDRPADVEAQLEKSDQIHEALTNMNGEVEGIIKDGKILVDTKQVQNPQQLDLQLQELRSRYNILEARVVECRNDLQRALNVVKRLDKEMTDLDKFLSNTEKDLSKWETAEPSKLKEEVHYVEDVLEQIKRRENDFVIINQVLTEWTKLADGDGAVGTTNRVQTTRNRLKSLRERVSQWLDSLNNMEEENSFLKRDFDILVCDVNLWLDAAELTLSTVEFSRSSVDGQREALKTLYLDAIDTRPKIDQLRDKAVELISKSEEYQRDVEKDLTSVNNRWENFISQVKEQQRRLQIPSMSPTPKTPSNGGGGGTASKEVFQEVQKLQHQESLEETKKKFAEKPMPSPRLKRMEFVREPTPEDIAALGTHAPVLEKIDDVKTLMNALSDQLSTPVTSIDDWEKNLKKCGESLTECKRKVDEIVADGHHLAEMGPPELITQRILEDIDIIAENNRKLEKHYERQNEILTSLKPSYENYRRDTERMIAFLNNLKQRTDDDPSTYQATKDELLARQEEYDSIRRKALNFQQKLPKSSDEATTTAEDPMYVRVRERWQEIENQFERFKDEQESFERNAELKTFADTVSALEKMMDGIGANLKAARDVKQSDYALFSSQDDLLKTIKEHIEAVEANITKLEERKESVMKSASKSGGEQIDPIKVESLMKSLRAHLLELNETYNQRVKAYEASLDNWQVFHRNVHSIFGWLDQIEAQLVECRKTDARSDVEQAELYQKDFEKGLYQKEAELRVVNNVSEDLLKTTSQTDSNLLKEKLESLNRRFHKTAAQIAERRERLDQNRDDDDGDSELRNDIDEVLFWMDETEALLTTIVDPTDHSALADLLERFKEKQIELPDKEDKIRRIEKEASAFLKSGKVPDAVKQGVRMDIQELRTRLKKAENDLKSKTTLADERLLRCSHFWHKLKELTKWCNNTKILLEQYHSAIIYTPTRVDPGILEKQINAKQVEMDSLSQTFAALREEARKQDTTIGEETETAVQKLLADWALVLNLAVMMRSSSSSASDTSDKEMATTSDDQQVERQQKQLGTAADTSPSVSYSVVMKERKKQQTTKTDSSTPETTPEPTIQPYDESTPRASDSEGQTPTTSSTVRMATDRQPSSSKTNELLKELTQMRHWLNDAQRENSGVIDVIDQKMIKDSLKKQQNFIDQLQTKRLQLIKILENGRNSEVQHKAEILSRDWERCVGQVGNRKKELTQMLEDSRRWDNLKAEIEMWLNGSMQKINGKKVSECTIQELHKELTSMDRLQPEVDVYKVKMTELNEASNRLIDSYSNDDTTAVSQITSDLNTQWSKLNDNLRVRRAVLEASLRGRNDFQTAFDEFDAWLNKIEQSTQRLDKDSSNTQLVKDATYRKQLMEKDKDLRAEIEAHQDILRSLRESGANIVVSLEKPEDKSEMQKRLDLLDERWSILTERSSDVQHRLETAQEQWERLTGQLEELLYWIETKNSALLDQQTVGGDLERCRKQATFCQNLQRDIEEKEPKVKEISQLAQSFLMQQDLRSTSSAKFYSPYDDVDEKDGGTKKNAARIAQQIKAEVDTLDERWPELKDRSNRWQKVVDDALGKMTLFDKAVQDCEQGLSESETTKRQWQAVKDLKLDDLPNQMELAKAYRQNVAGPLRRRVDDVNDHSSRLLADNISISPEMIKILEALNTRHKQLETAVGHRVQALENALRDFGPSSQHFLQGSVIAPWERSISANRVPYYINVESEKTQWDHPKMIEMMVKLCEFNEVKFSAYRTAMKLRCVQKRLFLDLLNFHDAVAVLAQQKLTGVNDKTMDVSEIVMTLLPIYEHLHKNHSDLLKSVPLAIDMCLNWLLNIFDPIRSGIIRVLSFKVALTLMCRAPLEEKYKFLYRQICSPNGGLDQKKLALLLHDCMQLPKYLGEVAAFGGTNIEPSVRSCFEQAKYPQEITLQNYLDWLKCEPQSLVWLPVMHRVAAGETAKHQAKCNVCKMFPIIGLRYRCLKCFNFDMCQNCFFSQRIAKSHKITHPMQEYCVASTSGEDVRDFSKVVKNKFKRKRYWKKHPRLGYLPVQTVAEGTPIEVRNVSPFNPQTQDLHMNIESFCSRLAELDKSQTFSGSNSAAEETFSDDEHIAIATLSSSLAADPLSAPSTNPRSPAQLVTLIDSAQREEYETILRHLEDENRRLLMEYEQVKATVATNGISPSATLQSVSTPQLPMTNGSLGRRTAGGHHRSTGSLQQPAAPPPTTAGSSVGKSGAGGDVNEQELLAEARALRQHKERLEQRSKVLEDHNRQLEVQLKRLKHLIDEQQLSEFSGSVVSQQSTPYTTPASSLKRGFKLQNGHSEEIDNYDVDVVHPSVTTNRVADLMSTAKDLGLAMGSLVNAVTSDDEFSGDEQDES